MTRDPVLSSRCCYFFLFFLILVLHKIFCVPVTILQFTQLALVPAGDLGEVTRDARDAVDLMRAAVCAVIPQAPRGAVTRVTRRELRRESYLIAGSVPESLQHEVANCSLRRLGLADPDVRDGACLNERVKEAFVGDPFDGVHRGLYVKMG